MLPFLVAFLAALRLGELWLASRNTRALLARGGIETGRPHYPLIVALHVAWLAALLLTVPWNAPANGFWLAVLVAVLGLRVWTIASLGPYWTTRIISLPGAPLISRGPYRYVSHPNYLIVAAELAVVPLAFGAWQLAAVFTVLNAAMLAWRIHVENRALALRRAAGPS